MELQRLIGGVVDGPCAVGRDVGVAACCQGVGLVVQRQGHGAAGDKQHCLRVGVRLRAGGAAVRGDFYRVLGEGFCKSRERAGQNPDAGVGPIRQQAGDDIAVGAGGQDRVGGGEDGGADGIAVLFGQATEGEGVLGHSRSSRRRRAMRSTCLQASVNSVSVSLAIRRSNADRIEALSWSRTAMMNGKPCFSV